MSTPEQEARSLNAAFQFLLDLSSGAEESVPSATRERARAVVKHFPLDAGGTWLRRMEPTQRSIDEWRTTRTAPCGCDWDGWHCPHCGSVTATSGDAWEPAHTTGCHRRDGSWRRQLALDESDAGGPVAHGLADDFDASEAPPAAPVLLHDNSFAPDPRGYRAFSYDPGNDRYQHPLLEGLVVRTRDLTDPPGTEWLARVGAVELGEPGVALKETWVYFLLPADAS